MVYDKEKYKIIYAKSGDSIRANSRLAYERNIDKILKSRRELYKKKHKDKKKEYYQKNKKYANNRQKEYHIRKYNQDVQFNTKTRMRVRFATAIKRGIWGPKTLRELGYDLDIFMLNLISKFKKGMNLSNYGKWHIDHVVPITNFNLRNKDEFRKCYHYSNLQPLWDYENRSKAGNIK